MAIAIIQTGLLWARLLLAKGAGLSAQRYDLIAVTAAFAGLSPLKPVHENQKIARHAKLYLRWALTHIGNIQIQIQDYPECATGG